MTPQDSPNEIRRLSFRRKLVFGALTAGLVVLLANEVVEFAERRGWIATHRRDDAVQFVEEAVFERDGDAIRTSNYGRESLPATPFAAEKGQGWRMFVLGGSFAMGSPYVEVEGSSLNTRADADERSGGIPGWLQLKLEEHFPGRAIEVINAAAGGQNSGRVMDLASEVLNLSPDLLLVATGNNEGTLQPSRMQEQLHRLGGYRLLQKLLTRDEKVERSWFTPQDPDTVAIRNQFRNNLHSLVREAGEKSVPVLLCTLPVNLRYTGFEPGHVLGGRDWPHVEGPCYDGITLFDIGDYERALPALLDCRNLPQSNHPPPLEALITMARMELSIWNDEVLAELESLKGACIARGIEHYFRQQYRAALDHLPNCDDVADSLLWLGLSHRALGQTQEAQRLLEQHVELIPRNRCRPSFNRIIRDVAAAHEHVFLVDLEEAAKQNSPERIPGSELFLDYCHMNWKGYAGMAAEVFDVLIKTGHGPGKQ